MFNTGQELKWARQNAGLTQTQLAEKVGTGQAYIAQLEKRAEVPYKIRARIIEVLSWYYPETSRDAPSAVGGGRKYQRLSPEEKALNRALRQQEAARLEPIRLRNSMRDAARNQIADIRKELEPFVVSGDWPSYHAVLVRAATAAVNRYVLEFLAVAKARVVPDSDETAVLAPESLPKINLRLPRKNPLT